jgi:hypothetical protein
MFNFEKVASNNMLKQNSDKIQTDKNFCCMNNTICQYAVNKPARGGYSFNCQATPKEKLLSNCHVSW